MVILNIALQSLTKNKTRTFLTILGTVIGIAAIIIVMSAGEGLKAQITGQIESFGSNVIQIEPKVPTTGRNSTSNATAQAQGIQINTLKIEDGEAIKKLSNINNFYAALMGQEVASFAEINKYVTIMGVSSAFIEMDQSKVAKGRFFSDSEDNELAKVVVLGSKLAAKLFGNNDPIRQNVKLGKNKFVVIGILQERGGGFGLDFDELIYMPVQTLQKVIMGVDHVLWVTAQTKDKSLEYQTADDITQTLRARHGIEDPKYDDFSVTTMSEARDMVDTIFNAITLLLIALAGISLLVAGVGIMNIMYVSVSERTFEIGLRKAIGAKQKQILWQFLFEAIIITLLGGFFGIITGLIISWLISFIAGQLGFSWDFILPPQAIAIAFGFCGAVGLIFGYWPAKTAAKMDPINALRHE